MVITLFNFLKWEKLYLFVFFITSKTTKAFKFLTTEGNHPIIVVKNVLNTRTRSTSKSKNVKK